MRHVPFKNNGYQILAAKIDEGLWRIIFDKHILIQKLIDYKWQNIYNLQAYKILKEYQQMFLDK